MHMLNHTSENFSVRGPLNVERCPQGYPVMLVAGASERGKELAAETGDALFTAQPDKAQGQAFYKDVKARMARYGRSPDELKIMPGAMIIVAETDAEAKEKRDYLRSLIDIEFAVQYMSSLAGMDLSHLPLDKPLPDSLRSQPVWSRLELMMDVAERDHLNFRELAIQYTETYGHQFMVGSLRPSPTNCRICSKARSPTASCCARRSIPRARGYHQPADPGAAATRPRADRVRGEDFPRKSRPEAAGASGCGAERDGGGVKLALRQGAVRCSPRHCERSEAIQCAPAGAQKTLSLPRLPWLFSWRASRALDCFVASLLAMTQRRFASELFSIQLSNSPTRSFVARMERSEIRGLSPRKNPGLRFAPSGLQATRVIAPCFVRPQGLPVIPVPFSPRGVRNDRAFHRARGARM